MSDDRESHPSFENGQDIRDRTFRFACEVATYCQRLYDRGGVPRVMVPQLVSASTSIAAMLEEACGAESRRDFISKCSIGLKEARETWVRLRVSGSLERGNQETQRLVREAEAIVKILAAIIRNTRRNGGIGRR